MRRRWLFGMLASLLVVSSFGTEAALAVSHDLAKARGCRTGGFKERNRVDPEWVSVMPDDAPQVAEGVVRASHVAVNDWPPTHDSHDWNFVVTLGPRYNNLHSNTNPTNSGQQQMEMEWEEKYFPVEFRPAVYDRFWMLGRWVFDCGHPPDYRTEIHPPKAVAFTRSTPLPVPITDTQVSSANTTFVYIHGRGGYYNTSVAQQDYDFDIPMPPKPRPTSDPNTHPQPRITITIDHREGHPTTTVTPIVTPVPATNPTHVHVHFPLASTNDPSPDREFGVTIVTAWKQAVPTMGFRTLCVTLDSIQVLNDHDPFGAGEWRLRLYDGQKWVLPSPAVAAALEDVNGGDVVALRDPHTGRACDSIVNVPETGSIRIGASGWESDPIDSLFGSGSIGLSLADENDDIGFVNHAFGASENFGIDTPHDTLSRRTEDEERFDTDPPPDRGGGDYRLRYHITQLPGVSPLRTTVPEVLELNPTTAKGRVIAAGLVPQFSGAEPTMSSYVSDQDPPGGTRVDRGTTVVIFLHKGPVP